jgi:aryl-phospho-beta-D-glucosidase BglC (GH1 family)
MRASPAWFTSRPLSSYPADDEGELDDPFFARETPAASTASFNGKRVLGFGLISVLGILLSLFVMSPLVRDTLMGLRSVPPGLWSNNGVLMIGKEQFHLKGVSWFGFEGPTNCLEGLSTGENSLDNILDIVRVHNFNLLRLPLALDKWLENPSMAPTCISAFANPDLKLHPYRRLIRLVIERAAEKDLLVLLDLHRLDSNIWPSDGKWSSKAVSPEIVVTFWENLAVEFGRQWNVVGADIFNEVMTY